MINDKLRTGSFISSFSFFTFHLLNVQCSKFILSNLNPVSLKFVKLKLELDFCKVELLMEKWVV